MSDGQKSAGKPEEIEVEDLIAEEDMVITISNTGYIKRLAASAYRKQRRGAKALAPWKRKKRTLLNTLFIASSKDYLLIFSNKGMARWLKVYEIPIASRTSKGKAIVNLLTIEKDEYISSVVAVKEFSEEQFVVMATEKGCVKKTKLSAFSNPGKLESSASR